MRKKMRLSTSRGITWHTDNTVTESRRDLHRRLCGAKGCVQPAPPRLPSQLAERSVCLRPPLRQNATLAKWLAQMVPTGIGAFA